MGFRNRQKRFKLSSAQRPKPKALAQKPRRVTALAASLFVRPKNLSSYSATTTESVWQPTNLTAIDAMLLRRIKVPNIGKFEVGKMTKERIKGLVVAAVAVILSKVLDALLAFIVEKGLEALSKIL